MKIYETVKAKTHLEAEANCEWVKGQMCIISDLHAIANADGTFYVSPIFEVIETKEQAIARINNG